MVASFEQGFLVADVEVITAKEIDKPSLADGAKDSVCSRAGDVLAVEPFLDGDDLPTLEIFNFHLCH